MGSDADSPGRPGSGTGPDDVELLVRWREGDRSAGNRLVRKHYKTVAAAFTNAVGDDERQDLVQETFGRLTTAKDGFRGDGGVRAYILAIARNVLLDHLRKRYRGGTGFDPLTTTIVIDYAAVVAASDLATNGGGPPGCMSGTADPECGPVFDRLGIDIADGSIHPEKQVLFRAK